MNAAIHVLIGTYRKITPDSFYRAGLYSIGLLIMLYLFGVWSFGVYSGASAAIQHESISHVVAAAASVETGLWMDMIRDGAPVVRAAYGVFHWLAVIGVWVTVQGIKMGYSVPELGYALSYLSEPIVYGIALVFVAQNVRAFELGWKMTKGEGDVSLK